MTRHPQHHQHQNVGPHHKETEMYTRRMQRIRRTAQERRVHETQRQAQVAAEREQVRAVIHSIVR